MRSSTCSIPTDSRTSCAGTSHGDPATLACVIGPGTSINDSTPPSDSARKNSSARSAIAIASWADTASNDTIPPYDDICRLATS